MAASHSYVTGIDVSYGAALLPTPFKRLATKIGAVVNLQAVPGGTPVSLWLRHGDEGAAVLALAVLYDDEPVPDGLKKIARDLTAGATPGKTVYLAALMGELSGDAKPITALSVLADGDAPGMRTRVRARSCH
jgi:hypothetical protein